jgi:hypothetical protein
MMIRAGGDGTPVKQIESLIPARVWCLRDHSTLDGDTWTHAGTLSNDFRVREIWRRVK